MPAPVSTGGPELIDAAEQIFSKNCVLAYHSRQAKFRDWTTVEESRGAESITFHLMGDTIAEEHPGGSAPVSFGNVRQAKKQVFSKNFQRVLPTSVFDQAKMSTPQARMKYSNTIVGALNRREDRECVLALRDATYVADYNSVAGGSTGFSYVKWTGMIEYFEAREIPNERICLALSEREIRQLLHEDRIISADYRRGKAKPTKEADIAGELGIGGIIKLGTKARELEGGLPDGATSSMRYCYAWDKERLGLSDNVNMQTGVGWSIVHLSNAVWGIQAIAATVIDDLADGGDTDGAGNAVSEGVYRIECKKDATLS